MLRRSNKISDIFAQRSLVYLFFFRYKTKEIKLKIVELIELVESSEVFSRFDFILISGREALNEYLITKTITIEY